MPITEARLARLRGFGLSEYGARAYLALLDLGASEARHISGLSKVPTSKIYHVLDQLHERGLVEVLPEFPKRYAPVPFEDFLNKRLAEHQENARAITRDRDALLSEFAIAGDVRLPDRGSLQVVRGRGNVTTRLQEVAAAAESDLILLVSRGLAARGPSLAPALAAAAGRGVRVRVLLPADAPAAVWGGAAEVATVPELPGAALAVADGRVAVLAAFVPDDDSATRGQDLAALTDHEALARLVRAMAEREWSRAVRPAAADFVGALNEAALLARHGRVVALSARAAELLGLPAGQAVGWEVERVLPGGLPAETPAGPWAASLRRPDGASEEVSLTVSVLAEGLALIVLRPQVATVPVEGTRVAQVR